MGAAILQRTTGSQKESFPLSFHSHTWTGNLLRGLLVLGQKCMQILLWIVSVSYSSCHKVRQNQQKYILSHFWRPKVQYQFHWAKMKGPRGPPLSGGLGEKRFVASSSFWQLPTLLGVGPYHSDLCLSDHTAPPLLSKVKYPAFLLSRCFQGPLGSQKISKIISPIQRSLT